MSRASNSTTVSAASPRDLVSFWPADIPLAGGIGARVGVWAASPALGPQIFTAPIVAGANRFVIALQLSGGGGVDGWSSRRVTLP